MLDIEKLPIEPDEALLFIGKLMGDNFDEMFDSEGFFDQAEYAYVSSIQKVIDVSASRSSFSNRDEYIYVARELDAKLRNFQLDKGVWDRFSARLQAASFHSRFVSKIDADFNEPMFELSEDDIGKVQDLASEMRVTISTSNIFDSQHKVRLLNRISSIEKEILKPKGRLDVIFGGVSDFGDALNKFGSDVEPLVRRINEIRGIAQPTSDEYKGLPAPEEMKRLPAPED